jgi:hypothetical protein
MTRRRIILSVLGLLLAAFFIAVQRDTFVRRWCLSAPGPASPPANVLGRVVDEFSLSGITHTQAVQQLEQRIGVPIHFDQHSLWDEPITPMPSCTVRGATVEQLLSRILIGIPFSFPRETYVVAADGSVTAYDETINTHDDTAGRSVPAVARVHVIDPVLAAPAARWHVLRWDGVIRPGQAKPTQISDNLRRLTRHIWRPGMKVTSDPVLRFGDRWLIVTTPRNHWLIDEIVREELVVHRASAASGPAPPAR